MHPPVFELPSSKYPRVDNRMHIFRANLAYLSWDEGNATTKEIMMTTKIRLSHGGRGVGGDLDATATFVHSSCLLLMKRKMEGIQISPALLLHIARQLRPLVEWRQLPRLMGWKTTPMALPCPETSDSTLLGSLISEINKLPLELQRMIRDFVPECFFASLSRCSETLNAIKYIQDAAQAMPMSLPEYTYQYPFSGQPSTPSRLSANTVQVLGERCLTEIGTDLSSNLEIPVKDLELQAVQYALGTYGVVAFRLLYIDGSYSSWLGGSPRLWVTTVRGDQIQELMALTDVRSSLLSVRGTIMLICPGLQNHFDANGRYG